MTTEVIEATGREVAVVEQSPTLYGTNNPTDIIEKATAQANVLATVIEQKKLFTQISGRRHVRVEGWTTCGALVGVFPVLVWTHEVEGGWEARVEARTLNGAIVGAAEAECLRSEQTWAKRDDYALRSMAQTRATSKALRQPLGWIVTLAGFDATPEEEVPHEPPRRVPPKEAAEAGAAFTAASKRLADETHPQYVKSIGEEIGRMFPARVKDDGKVDYAALTVDELKQATALILEALDGETPPEEAAPMAP